MQELENILILLTVRLLPAVRSMSVFHCVMTLQDIVYILLNMCHQSLLQILLSDKKILDNEVIKAKTFLRKKYHLHVFAFHMKMKKKSVLVLKLQVKRMKLRKCKLYKIVALFKVMKTR